MKAAFFIRSLQNGGAEKQSILLSNYLNSEITTYLIVIHKSKDNLLMKSNTTAQVIYLNGNTLKSLVNLYKILKKNNITVLINFLPINNIIGTIIGKLAGVQKIYCSIRGARLNKPWLKRFIQKVIVNGLSDGVLSNSFAGKEAFASFGYRKSNIHYLPNIYIPSNYIKKLESNVDNVVNILSVGRFVYEKDYETALKAIKVLMEKYSAKKINYTIVGYGKEEEKIISFINENKLNDFVNIIDGQKNSPHNYYKESDIYLITSLFEGTPNTIMEAMDYCLPIVATDAGDSNVLVKDGVNGYLIEKRNFELIAEKLVMLINDRNMRFKFGSESKRILIDNFSPSISIDKLLNVIYE